MKTDKKVQELVEHWQKLNANIMDHLQFIFFNLNKDHKEEAIKSKPIISETIDMLLKYDFLKRKAHIYDFLWRIFAFICICETAYIAYLLIQD